MVTTKVALLKNPGKLFFLLDGTGLSRTVSVSSKDYICLKSDCIILAHTIR